MSSSQILTLLTNTLNPSLLESSQRQLSRIRSSPGFIPQLLLIADTEQISIQIRQQALITLKNLLVAPSSLLSSSSTPPSGSAWCSIPPSDLQTLKQSILDAFARQWHTKPLIRLYRQIIFLLAQRQYPQNWNILSIVIGNIEQMKDIGSVASSVEVLKAITSVCGGKLGQEVSLSNLCNRIFVPLLELANKLFANYGDNTQGILVSIFKIFNLAIFYYLPNIFINNIHSLMIFCKKILDLQIKEMQPLKLICLKILSRLYSRHVGGNVGYKLLQFAQQFHEKYSISMIQSFIMQLMDQNNTIQICNLSLNCLTSIYKSHEKSSQIIDKYHEKILQLCLMRYKTKTHFQNQSIGSFITHLQQQRNPLIDFFSTIFPTNPSLLSTLLNYLTSTQSQQLTLYIFTALSSEVEAMPSVHGSMCQFILTHILPILSNSNSNSSSSIIKAHCCQLLSMYSYLQLPQQNLQQLFKFLYSCLTEQKDIYLRIYALQAFTKLIGKYDIFIKMLIPYIEQIIKVYTKLMKQANGQVWSVVKSFQIFISMLDGKDVNNLAIDLIGFFVGVFYEYAEAEGNGTASGGKVEANGEQGDGDLSSQDDEDEDLCTARQGCLACIRQILVMDNLQKNVYQAVIGQYIVPLAVSILVDKELMHFQQCLNILNLCLFKSDELPNNFDQFFKIFTYAIVGIPSQLASINLPNQYKQILQNVCVQPDEDLIQNVIGFFRNFISKSTNRLRDMKDQLGISFLQYIFLMVQTVQTKTQNSPPTLKYKSSDRSLILTLYTCLLQHNFLSPNQFQSLVSNLMTWFANSNTNTNNTNTNTNTNTKLTQQKQNNNYLQILLICLYYCPQITAKILNLQQFLSQIIARISIFQYQYQLQRLVLGVCRLMEKGMLQGDTAMLIVKIIPDMVAKLVARRVQDNQNEQLQRNKKPQQADIEQQAQQDLIAENTHLYPSPPANQASQCEKQQHLHILEQQEWQQQYNKYYNSPYMGIKQLEYLTQVLKNSQYLGMLTVAEQERLTGSICEGVRLE